MFKMFKTKIFKQNKKEENIKNRISDEEIRAVYEELEAENPYQAEGLLTKKTAEKTGCTVSEVCQAMIKTYIHHQ